MGAYCTCVGKFCYAELHRGLYIYVSVRSETRSKDRGLSASGVCSVGNWTMVDRTFRLSDERRDELIWQDSSI